MNAVGITILRGASRVDSYHLEAREFGVIVVSNDKFEVQIQQNDRGEILSVTTSVVGCCLRSPAFASVLLAVGERVGVVCE